MRILKRIWNSIRQWKGWRQFTSVRIAGMLLGLFGVVFGVVAYLVAHDLTFDWKTFAADYGANCSTSLISFTIAVLLIDFLNERRIAGERKRAIIQQMSSRSNDFALEAVRIAGLEGWLSNGALRGANLRQANLHGAVMWREGKEGERLIWSADLQKVNLQMANLEEAQLGFANLQKALLMNANLRNAILRYAKLQKAVLADANLEGAFLDSADLQEAVLNSANLQRADLNGANLTRANLPRANLAEINLTRANLQGTNLMGANLQRACLKLANLQGATLEGANLHGAQLVESAQFNEDTMLPDGTKWTPGTDLFHFTAPDLVAFV